MVKINCAKILLIYLCIYYILILCLKHMIVLISFVLFVWIDIHRDFPGNMITTLRTSLFSLLLLIFLQMTASLMFFAAVFIYFNHVTISPFHVCINRPHDEIICGQASPLPDQTMMSISTTAIILSLYVPLVLVAFALLSLLLSAYGGGDLGALQLSLWCQAASSGLTLLGLCWFVGLYWAYTSPSAMTLCFYSCVCVPVELTTTTFLSYMLMEMI